MSFISYSQNGEDVILWRALKHIENGFYIDVGACDPDELSVTKAFYERGWHGVNIEPVREYYELCVQKRPRDKNINVAVAERSGLSRFMMVKGTGLSTTVDVFATKAADKGWDVEAQEVLALSLADICSSLSVHEVHFLKIDVEGAERAVLEGADFEQVRPWIVVVEATAPLSAERIEHLWEHILLQAGYQKAFFDGVNLYYVAQEHSELIETLAAPPNALDDFKPVRMAEAEEHIARLSAELEARHRRQTELETVLEALRLEHTTQIAAASDQATAHALDTARQAEAHALAIARQAEANALAIARQAEANETGLVERDRRISELLSRNAHQTSSATQKLAFTSRRLAQSRRRIIELEEQVHAQQHSLDSLNSLVSALKSELEIQGTKLDELEDRAEKRIYALATQYEILTKEHDRIKEHRDALLVSTSWRVSAPLRKAKTAFQIVRSQPHLVMPLVAENFRRRPRTSPELLAGSATRELPLISHQEHFVVLDEEGDFPAIEMDPITETPSGTISNRHGELAMLIRNGIAKRRLLNR